MIKKVLILIKKWSLSKTKFSDLQHFSLGNYRYKLYYYRRYKENFSSPLMIFMRTHIKEQIEYRIAWMDRECYDNGECKICTCSTTALQMANKPCDKPCYPTMMSAWAWRKYKKGHKFIDKNGTWLALLTQNLKPILYTNDNTPKMDIISLQEEEKRSQRDYPTGKY